MYTFLFSPVEYNSILRTDTVVFLMTLHTLILSSLLASGSEWDTGITRIFWVFADLSAIEAVIFLCVNESVECGLQKMGRY